MSDRLFVGAVGVLAGLLGLVVLGEGFALVRHTVRRVRGIYLAYMTGLRHAAVVMSQREEILSAQRATERGTSGLS